MFRVSGTIMAEIITIDADEAYIAVGARAASALDRGGVVAFPTETVYGVGARADLPAAVRRLRRLKERTDGKPFTVHIPERDHVPTYVPELPGLGRRLIRKGWPGPITLLFRLSDPSAAPVLNRGVATLAGEIYRGGEIGLRCPDHDLARRILAGVAGPVVAASANRAGSTPACTASEVLRELGDDIDLLVDGGTTQFGRPSSVVRVGENRYEVLREGVYDERMLRRLASMNFLFVCTGNTCRSPMAAGMFRRMLARRLSCAPSELPNYHIEVRSAGTFAGGGSPSSPEAIEVMRRREIDITAERSTRLSPELIEQADRIYVMTRSHAKAVTAIVPSAEEKTQLLSEDGDIDDPIGAGVSVYESYAAKIEKALTARLGEVEL